jgi:hypothetical protein
MRADGKKTLEWHLVHSSEQFFVHSLLFFFFLFLTHFIFLVFVQSMDMVPPKFIQTYG